MDPEPNPYEAPLAPQLMSVTGSEPIRSGLRFVIGLTGALTIPFGVEAAYIVWTHWQASAGLVAPGRVDLAWFAACFGSGAACLWLLPVPRGWRVAFLFAYVPLLLILMYVFEVSFRGALYDEYL